MDELCEEQQNIPPAGHEDVTAETSDAPYVAPVDRRRADALVRMAERALANEH